MASDAEKVREALLWLENCLEHNPEAQEARREAQAALSRLEAEHERLRNLLAVLNSDGGHRQVEVGIDQAAREAEERFHRLRADAERLELLRGYVGRSKVWTPVELATLRRLVFGEPP